MALKLKLPAILMAHDLLEGHVVFWNANGWSRNLDNPQIAFDEATQADLQTILDNEIAKNIVVDAELAEVNIEGGNIKPRHFREVVKTVGPSIKYGVVI